MTIEYGPRSTEVRGWDEADIHNILDHAARLYDVALALPESFPNRPSILQHVRAIADLTPPLADNPYFPDLTS